MLMTMLGFTSTAGGRKSCHEALTGMGWNLNPTGEGSKGSRLIDDGNNNNNNKTTTINIIYSYSKQRDRSKTRQNLNKESSQDPITIITNIIIHHYLENISRESCSTAVEDLLQQQLLRRRQRRPQHGLQLRQQR
jgi:hypothetical protein